MAAVNYWFGVGDGVNVLYSALALNLPATGAVPVTEECEVEIVIPGLTPDTSYTFEFVANTTTASPSKLLRLGAVVTAEICPMPTGPVSWRPRRHGDMGGAGRLRLPVDGLTGLGWERR